MTTIGDPALKIVRAVCPHDCPDTCAMLVTVQDGRAIKIGGDPDHPVTQGFLCAKVSRYIERTYHQDRLRYPMRRIGPRGSGQYERITWDEALAEIAARFKGIVAEYGPQAILPYSYAGAWGMLMYASMDRRFFNKLGASQLERTICATAGYEGYSYTVGAGIGTDPEQYANARLILLWGTNTLTSNPHLWPFIKRARANGARVIAIDPYRSRTAQQCDEHLALNVGTDAALALGMLHVIFAEGLEDRDYLRDYTVGEAELRARAAEYDPARVAAITGLTTTQIIDLARAYATTQPAAIRINYGMQRHAGGAAHAEHRQRQPQIVEQQRRPRSLRLRDRYLLEALEPVAWHAQHVIHVGRANDRQRQREQRDAASAPPQPIAMEEREIHQQQRTQQRQHAHNRVGVQAQPEQRAAQQPGPIAATRIGLKRAVEHVDRQA